MGRTISETLDLSELDRKATIFQLIPGQVALSEVKHLLVTNAKIEISAETIQKIEQSVDYVNQIILTGKTVYGINTGFGSLASVRISEHELAALQKNLVLSHATGIGDYLSEDVAKLTLLLKINALCQGHSGVSQSLISLLIKMYNHQVFPCMPEKGSVGASGDLAPLAHLACMVLGVGEVYLNSKIVTAEKALEYLAEKPFTLGPKEGLALLNGTQVSCALLVTALLHSQKTLAHGLISGAMSVEAFMGSVGPFDVKIHQLKRHKGQQLVAESLRVLLKGSQIVESHSSCDRVQDPYSLRCQPQVMGSCLEAVRYVAAALEDEINAVSDNPLIFADQDQVLSGGNFHAESIGLLSDYLAVAIAEVGAISERRIALLVDANMSRLPPFLAEKSGVRSGFMIAHVSASALASENKSLAHPATVDSLPTSANQEDHVSMATYAARRLHGMLFNVDHILAVEFLAAANGIEFRRPLKSSPSLERVVEAIRQKIANYDTDRFFHPDLVAMAELIKSSVLLDHTELGAVTLFADSKHR